MKTQRWQDRFVFILGIWLVFSPLIGIGVTNDVAALNSYLVGSIVILLSTAAIAKPQMWEEYIQMIIGIWLFFSPYIFGFSYLAGPTWNQMLVGIFIGGSAVAIALKNSNPRLTNGHPK